MESVEHIISPVSTEAVEELLDDNFANPVVLGVSVAVGASSGLISFKATIGSQPHYNSFVPQAEGCGMALGGIALGILFANAVQRGARGYMQNYRGAGALALSASEAPAEEEAPAVEPPKQ